MSLRSPERFVLVGILVLAPALAGCVPFVPCYYAYPSVACVPGVKIEPPSDDVHVFRVDIADTCACMDIVKPGRYQLTPMHVWPGGWTCPQAKLALDGGYIWNCIALIFSDHTCHTVRVRLYRPGYDVVEIKAWSQPDELIWTAAPDPQAQEQAVDDLLAPTGVGGWGSMCKRRFGEDRETFAHLRPGWIAPKHREALAFAALEYERVAALYAQADSNAATGRDRCQKKARLLRELPVSSVPLICPRLPWADAGAH